jgi:hypothetical protein
MKGIAQLEDMYKTLLFYAGNGYDPAIVRTDQDRADAHTEVCVFINEARPQDHEIMLAFYRSLLDMKGFEHTKNSFEDTGIEDRFPILTRHLILSVYS